MKSYVVTYHEKMLKPDEALAVDEGVTLQVLEVHRMGPDLMWRYVLRVPVEDDA